MNTAGEVSIRPRQAGGCTIAGLTGRLDGRSYGELRDGLIRLTLDQPRALIAEVDGLEITSEPALTVFSAVRTRTNSWPGVPVLLVARDRERRAMITASAVHRFVPLHSCVEAAVGAVAEPPSRRRRSTGFPPVAASSHAARRFTRETCRGWNIGHRQEDALGVATELVENAVTHAGSPLELRLELRDGRLTIAVRDEDPRPAVLRQQPGGALSGYGLQVIAALSDTWGCAPAPGGKIVWAVLRVGPRHLAPFRVR
ncbi:ATP-binding protein [Amycolatopsis viridis]|uniref:Anti-sigma regulatory factor (Ser/Thr protein kinase) n=1 Tax=Amycolatopsis viridis TaxID=185678 RepID=A0ABX0SYE7_9PSEU|nr:ATP-binding protein [Amycolatopsis viridis]NIH81994.1 anti-sigma regulatory factor (Ser/Thr protein kinase) [Amycolatopsis viridis]